MGPYINMTIKENVARQSFQILCVNALRAENSTTFAAKLARK